MSEIGSLFLHAEERLKGCKKGVDDAVFRDIQNEVAEIMFKKPLIRKVIAKCGVLDCNIDDVIQNVLVEFCESYDPMSGSISSFIASHLKFRAIDQYRLQTKTAQSPDGRGDMVRLDDPIEDDEGIYGREERLKAADDGLGQDPEKQVEQRESIDRVYYEMAQQLISFYEDRDKRAGNPVRRELFGIFYTYDLLCLKTIPDFIDYIDSFKHERDICKTTELPFLNFSTVEDSQYALPEDVTLCGIYKNELKKYIEVVTHEMAEKAKENGMEDAEYPLNIVVRKGKHQIQSNSVVLGYFEHGRDPVDPKKPGDVSNALKRYNKEVAEVAGQLYR